MSRRDRAREWVSDHLKPWVRRRNPTILVIIGLIIGIVAAPVIAQLASGPAVSGTISLQTNSGMTVNVSGANNITGQPFADDNTVNVDTDKGNATFIATGSASADVDASNLTGPWTNVTNLDVATNEIYINPDDKRPANISGDADAFAFRKDISVTDDKADFVYEGASGTTTVTVRGVAPSVQIVAVDSNGDSLESASSNSNGVVTLSGMPNSKHVVTLEAEEGPFVDTADPDDEYINNRNVDLNATVIDPRGDDFEDVWLQTYDGTNWVNQTVESNLPSGNEINASVTARPGTNKYRVVMNATGNRDRVSENFTYRTPGIITIYNGTSKTKLTQTTVSGEVSSTESDFKDSLTTTTGEADLVDINPPDEIHSSEWSAAGVDNQTLIIRDPSENTTVALYESSASGTYTQCFSVSDPTGTFNPGDSWVVVEGYINGKWTTVGSERFGVENEADIVLEDGEDYRVRLRNDDGDLRVLGGFTGDSSNNCVPLEVTSSIDEPSDVETVNYNATCTDTNPKRVKFEYNDTTRQTSTIYYTVYEYRNTSNVLVPNTTFTGTFGEFSYTANIPSAENNTTWTVDAIGVRDNAENVQIEEVVCGQTNIVGDMPPWFVSFLFVGLIWTTAGLFSRLNGHIGGLVVAGLGAMFWFSGLAPPGLGGGVVALSMLTAGVLFVRERGGGL